VNNFIYEAKDHLVALLTPQLQCVLTENKESAIECMKLQ